MRILDVVYIPNCPLQVSGILAGLGSHPQELWHTAPRGNIQGEMGNARSLRGLLRNSSRASIVDQMQPDCVCSITKSDKISSNVPDSFSHDTGVFEFRISPLRLGNMPFPSFPADRPHVP